MDEAGARPYRELVEHHLRRQSESQLQIASLGEFSGLPDRMRSNAITFIDVVNERLGANPQFWANATCREAYDRFIELAIEVVSDEEFIGHADDPLWLQDEELAMQLFQIPTVSFAYSASSQRAQRRFMGIRKGIFG